MTAKTPDMFLQERIQRLTTAVQLGTPDEVQEYSTRLIREVGPGGFILAQGCAIPPNAKLENVQAMVAAAHG